MSQVRPHKLSFPPSASGILLKTKKDSGQAGMTEVDVNVVLLMTALVGEEGRAA